MDYADAVNQEIARPEGGRRRCGPARRALSAGARRRARRLRRPAINRALEGIQGRHHSTSASATRTSSTSGRRGYSFLPELAMRRASRSRSRPRNRSSTSAILAEPAGKTIMLGVISLGDPDVETPETVPDRIRPRSTPPAGAADPGAPDCGMKYLPRAAAFGKLRALAQGAAIVRRELAQD